MKTQYLKTVYNAKHLKNNKGLDCYTTEVSGTKWENCALLQFVATVFGRNEKIFACIMNEKSEVIYIPVRSEDENERQGPNLKFVMDTIHPAPAIILTKKPNSNN